MSFTKDDMQYKYSWTTIRGDDPRVSGEPDNTLLNRNEGYEMLYFINKCGSSWGWNGSAISAFKKLEKMIKQIVPTNIHSQAGIKSWIEQNFKSYWDNL